MPPSPTSDATDHCKESKSHISTEHCYARDDSANGLAVPKLDGKILETDLAEAAEHDIIAEHSYARDVNSDRNGQGVPKLDGRISENLAEQNAIAEHSYARDVNSDRNGQGVPKLDGRISENLAEQNAIAEHSYAIDVNSDRNGQGVPKLDGRISENLAEQNAIAEHSYAIDVNSDRNGQGVPKLDGRISENSKAHEVFSAARSKMLTAVSTGLVPVDCNETVLIEMTTAIASRMQYLNNRKRGYVSCLRAKDYAAMKDFNWQEICDEMDILFPELSCIFHAIMLKPQDSLTRKRQLLPVLGTIYAMVMKTRHHELSRVQNVVSMCMADNIVDKQVR